MEICYPQSVLELAMSGQIHWIQAAEIIGISGRQMGRWKDTERANVDFSLSRF